MKKIMFSDRYGLTQAVLEGKKTMTRRIIPDIEIDWVRRGKVTLPVGGYEHGVLFADVRSILHDAGRCDYAAPTKYQPKYEKGEEIAIAQSYKDICLTDPIFFEGMRKEAGWSNKMFVCAEYMPHRIRITDIKVERLQDISEEDAMKEGVEKWMGGYIVTGIMERHGQNNAWFKSPRDAFFRLFTKLCGYKARNTNPWVYAYTFELVR